MTDLVDVDEFPKSGSSGRWPNIELTTIRVVPPIISIVCAIVAGYLTSMIAKPKPPADIAALAVSVLKSGDAPAAMQDWAADALGIQTAIPMPAKSIRQ